MSCDKQIKLSFPLSHLNISFNRMIYRIFVTYLEKLEIHE